MMVQRLTMASTS